MNNEYAVNKELLLDFLDESIESLGSIDAQLVNLESEPGNIDLINSIFRPIHSLKGNSAYFGLLKVKSIAHAAENILDAFRSGKLPVTPKAIGILLPAFDLLTSMVTKVRGGEEENPNQNAFDETLNAINLLLSSPATKTNIIQQTVELLRKKLEILAGSVPENLSEKITELISLTDRLAATDTMHSDPLKTKLDNSLGTIIKELYGILDRPLSGKADEAYITRIQSLLRTLSEQSGDVQIKDMIIEITDDISAFIRADTGFDNLLRELVLEKLKKMDSFELTAQKPGPETSSLSLPRIKNEKKHSIKDKTMRVAEKSVDSFLEYVGELVVVEEMFTYLWKRLQLLDSEISKDFRKTLDAFIVLADQLRTGILSIRKVEAGTLLQKAPRIVRDIASKTGKQITVTCFGEEVKIDKSYIDSIDAALTHMIRNAADHGIETPEKRSATGKPEEGTIIVSVTENNNGIDIVVKDDGAGLNLDALRKKAIDIGMISSNDALTEERIVSLVFASGVSTAQTISDISGRGVGMDVVKKTIDSLNGKIAIESHPNKGCTFTITLPKSISTQIFEGYLVRTSNGEVYVLPLLSILEAFSLVENEISTVTGKGEYVVRHGCSIPVVRLDNKFDCLKNPAARSGTTLKNENETVTMLSMSVNKMKYACMVSEIIGVQKVVSKPIEGIEYNRNYFDGASMMGDGSVAMIISQDGLRNLVSS